MVKTVNQEVTPEPVKPVYSFWIGLLKSVQNVAVTVGVPAVVVLLNGYVDWLPTDWYPVAVPIISVVAYLLKNYLKNK